MSFAGRGSGVGQAGGGGGACVRVVCSDWATDGVHNDDCNELDESVGEARPECDEIGACILWSEFEGAGGKQKNYSELSVQGGGEWKNYADLSVQRGERKSCLELSVEGLCVSQC